ncbi:hypothetical protein [Sphingomonas palmae]|uniref:hypothetical protein n=1 Tax=Sphingomonas palmae TaxID=1855283 RepID=UPI0015A512D9|nr:hypothetical protein [Sphingomonas palmae]
MRGHFTRQVDLIEAAEKVVEGIIARHGEVAREAGAQHVKVALRQQSNRDDLVSHNHSPAGGTDCEPFGAVYGGEVRKNPDFVAL